MALAALLHFVLPSLAKTFLQTQLGKAFQRPVSIERITLHPLTLSVEVQGLSVQKPSGGEQFGLQALVIHFSSLSVVQPGIVLNKLLLQSPRISLARLDKDRYDISDLLAQWHGSGQTTASSFPLWTVRNLHIQDGLLELEDRHLGIRHRVESVHFDLPFLSNRPEQADVFVHPALTAVVDGSEWSLQGQGKPFATSPVAALQLNFHHLDLSRLQPYLPADLPLRLNAGQLSSALKIDWASAPDAGHRLQLGGAAQLQGLAVAQTSGAPWLSLNRLDLDLHKAEPLQGLWEFGQLTLHGLQTTDAQGRPALGIEHLSASQARFDLGSHRLDAEQVLAHAVQTRLVRSAQGVWSWLDWPPALFRSAQTGQSPARSDSSETDLWGVRVGQLSLQESALRLEDHMLSPCAVQNLERIRLRLENLNSQAAQASDFTLSATLNGSGALQAQGAVQWQPLSLKMALESRALPLVPVRGYLAPVLNAILEEGRFSSKGHLVLQRGAALQARYSGSLALDGVRTVDKNNSADFLNWQSLSANALDFQLEPMRLSIGALDLTDFYARLILNEQGQLNLNDLLRWPDRSSSPPVALAIARIALQNGRLDFSDHFVRPHYSAQINRVGGLIEHLSSAADSLAELELRGFYANNAPVHIAATLNPLADKKSLDLRASVANIELVDFSPYSGKYAGYTIDKGKLSLDARYKLNDRQLTADNRLFIDQLRFGEKVESPQATTLPVHLALALLKNNRGEIDIHLPVSGSLDDPQFSLDTLVLTAMGNLFVKTVTAPFALLGSMFEQGPSLSHVAFAAGGASLEPSAVETLQRLARALQAREGLSLEITGRADPDLDLKALQGTQNSTEALRALAIRRALTVQNWLAEQGQVPLKRLFLLPVSIESDASKPDNPGSGFHRVDFSLR